MKIIIQILLLALVSLTFSFAYSQVDNNELDTLRDKKDTIGLFQKNREAFLNSPERLKIVELIEILNYKSSKVDNISSENIVKLKAASMNQTGNIDVRVKKHDSIWFKITGSFAFISKEAVIANVNRLNFIYFDNLNEKVIEGPTTDNNIGAIARIKCTFDDLLNVMSGTCRIIYSDDDTLSMNIDSNKVVISIIGKNKDVKYWINIDKKYIEKYSYFNPQKKEYLKIVYSNIVSVGEGYYARKVDIIKPMSNEYMKIVNESFLTNQSNLNYKVDFPSEVRRVKWEN